MADGYIRVIRDRAGIEELRSSWSRWHLHPNSDIDFYLTVIDSMPGILRPHILALYDGDIPQAMLVGRLEHREVGLRLGYKDVAKIKIRLITFIYRGFLGQASSANARLLLSDAIRLLDSEADAIMLSNLDSDSPLFHLAQQLPGFLTRDHAVTTTVHRGMNLPGSSEDLYQKFSGKIRKNLKWQAKKFNQDFAGNVSIRTFEHVSDLQNIFDDVEQVAKNTYQRGLGVGFVDTSEMRRRLHLEASKGWLRAFILYVENKPCAFWIGTLYNKVFHSDFMGYDSNYAKYSPGMFLIMKVLEEFCDAKGDDKPLSLDFGFGDAQYKSVLADSTWSEGSVFVFAHTFKGLGFSLARMPTILANRVAMNILGRANLLLRVKKMWRNRVK